MEICAKERFVDLSHLGGFVQFQFAIREQKELRSYLAENNIKCDFLVLDELCLLVTKNKAKVVRETTLRRTQAGFVIKRCLSFLDYTSKS